MTQLSIACKAVLEHEGKILLLRVGPKGGSERTIGTYDLPGGRLVAGESFAQTLQREIWEECALEVNFPAVLQPFYVDDLRLVAAEGLSKSYAPAQIIRLFFKVTAPAKHITLSYEHDDYVWLKLADAQQLNLFPGIDRALQALNA